MIDIKKNPETVGKLKVGTSSATPADGSIVADKVGAGVAPAAPFHTRVAATTSSTPLEVARLEVHDSGVNTVAGIGPKLSFYPPANIGSYEGASIAAKKESATDAQLETSLVFSTCPDGGTNTERLTISSTGLATFSNGIKTEKGIFSGSITIADDAAGSITPPRQGNMMTLTVNAEGSYPGHWGGLLFCDVGLSVTCKVLASQGGSPIGVDTDVTGTTGADVQTTVGGTPAAGAGQIGAIKIENRTGASATYYYTFIG